MIDDDLITTQRRNGITVKCQ